MILFSPWKIVWITMFLLQGARNNLSQFCKLIERACFLSSDKCWQYSNLSLIPINIPLLILYLFLSVSESHFYFWIVHTVTTSSVCEVMLFCPLQATWSSSSGGKDSLYESVQWSSQFWGNEEHHGTIVWSVTVKQ